jgi:hypothetical protein
LEAEKQVTRKLTLKAFYAMVKHLLKLSLVITWKAESISNELLALAKK